MQIIKSLWFIINPNKRAEVIILLALMALGSIVEMLGVSIIFPYMQVVQDVSLIESNPTLNLIYNALNISSTSNFLIFLSSIVLFVFIAKNIYSIYLYNFQVKFANSEYIFLGEKLLKSYLDRPYAYFLYNNSSDIIRNLTTSIPNACNGFLLQSFTTLTDLLIVIALIMVMFYTEPLAAIVTLGLISSVIFFFFKILRHRIFGYGQKSNQLYSEMVQHINQGVGGIKEIKVLDCGNFFLEKYTQTLKDFTKTQEKYQIIASLPRSLLEIIMMTGIISIVIVLLLTQQSLEKIVPILAVYVTALIRLIPSANRVVNGLNSLQFNRDAVNIISQEIKYADTLNVSYESDSDEQNVKFTSEISINHLSFRYPSQSIDLLKDLSLTIQRGQSVGFIGTTGSGKSTLIDLILGLLEPTIGTIKIDSSNINSNIKNWQKQIGYVPQQIYLSDSSILNNIALGVPEPLIDLQKIEEVIKLAGLNEFISTLPLKAGTLVGERGVQLSGGQRQRIGIARALYADPEILILDEATSALDNVTEGKIISSLQKLKKSKTVIMVAHRLSTVQHCDCLFLLKNGEIIDSGSFPDLLKRHPDFIQT